MPHITNLRYIGLCLSALLAITSTVSAEMMPFTMPWNDTSNNITNFSSTLHQPAGKFGRVRVDKDGHYTLNKETIRFFGANIASQACFPPKDKSKEIAKRYARMGFNVARFHHMDNSWTDSIIDYTQGGSTQLHAANLDRLDYFIACLKEAGVYVNLNLLNSRVFYPEDGLGKDIASVPWKEQAIIGMFHQGARTLQKSYAKDLLNHVNPYTQIAYKNDPAIAFVEINNENGLIHQWHNGMLEHLPKVFETPLSQKWNDWLSQKYQTNEQLYQKWGAIDEPLGASLIQNGQFSTSDTWNLEIHGSGEAAFTLTNTTQHPNAGKIEVTKTSSQSWHIQFNHANLKIEKGQIYTLNYWIKGNAGKSVNVSLMQAHPPYQGLDYSETVKLSQNWQQHTTTFIAKTSDENARFNIGNLASEKMTVYLADISLKKGGSIGYFEEGISLAKKNIPIFQKSTPGTVVAMKDWYQFMLDTEKEYWTDMKRFLKSIGYAGIQWGSTIMNSPPSAQAIYDSIDSHAYWSHPHFHGSEWSTTNWTVNNTPMVNDKDGGVLSTLAWQRVKGLPHNVTEYQHCAPNVYSSDAALFAAAYGSLQDWDGIYLFHYGSGKNDWDRGIFNGFFDIDQHPAKLVNASIASVLFRRYDIPKANTEIILPFGPHTELEVLSSLGGYWNVGDARHLKVGSHVPLIHQVSMDLTKEYLEEPENLPESNQEEVIKSDNGSIIWDHSLNNKSILSINGNRFKSVIGFDGGRTYDLGGIAIDPGQTELRWSCISAIITDGTGFSSLRSGNRGIIVTTGKYENTSMGWKDETKTSVGNNWGTTPTMIENIPATITLAASTNNVRIWALDEKGNRNNEIPVTPIDNNCYFHLGGENGSLWYEFEVMP